MPFSGLLDKVEKAGTPDFPSFCSEKYPKTVKNALKAIAFNAFIHGGEWRTRTVDLPRVRRTL